jgi:hypothetical protein
MCFPCSGAFQTRQCSRRSGPEDLGSEQPESTVRACLRAGGDESPAPFLFLKAGWQPPPRLLRAVAGSMLTQPAGPGAGWGAGPLPVQQKTNHHCQTCFWTAARGSQAGRTRGRKTEQRGRRRYKMSEHTKTIRSLSYSKHAIQPEF